MQILRLYSMYDTAVSAYLRPYWSDHKANAIRSFSKLVNDKGGDNMVADHPDQFVLFELGEFNCSTGVFTSHSTPLSLGVGVEYVTKSGSEYCDVSGVKLSKVS